MLNIIAILSHHNIFTIFWVGGGRPNYFYYFGNSRSHVKTSAKTARIHSDVHNAQ
jgi:hypothetical protein